MRLLLLQMLALVLLESLGHAFVLVMTRAQVFIALLISSVTPIKYLSVVLILRGMVTEHEAKILPISKPFANVDNRCGGILKLSLEISAALVLAALASFCKYGNVEKLESKSTPSRFISGVADIWPDPTLTRKFCLGNTRS